MIMPENTINARANHDPSECNSPSTGHHEEVEQVSQDNHRVEFPVNIAAPRTEVHMGREQNETHLNWMTTIFMAIFHVGAIAALFFFSWTNLIVAAVLYVFAIN